MFQVISIFQSGNCSILPLTVIDIKFYKPKFISRCDNPGKELIAPFLFD